MNTLKDFIENSTLTRLLANVFLFVIVLGASWLLGSEIMLGQPVNAWLVGVVGTALGSSIKILGINAGISFVKEEKQV